MSSLIWEKRRGVAQPGSAPGLGPGGRRFESCRPDKVEPSGERKTLNAAIAQLVEHDLAKVGVASSSLVCRSLTF